jgi:hypothetical protein
MTAKLRQHSLSSVRKLQELLHECNVQLATFRNNILFIGTPSDGPQLRKEIDKNARDCIRSCEITKNAVLPQKHESVEFTRHASQFIGCVSACVIEMKRCALLEDTFPMGDANIASPHIYNMENMLETLENLITVHYAVGEAVADQVSLPRRRERRFQCVCSKIKTSYA